MSVASLPTRLSTRGVVPWAVLGVGLALVVVNLALLFRGHAASAPGAEASAGGDAQKAAGGGLPGSVALPAGKLKDAKLAYDRVKLEALPTELGVPGRIEANQDRQVQVRPRTSGVIREVRVALGQNVKKGQTLAVIDSPDIGAARLLLRAKQRELATARTEADWKREIAGNVATLVVDLGKGTESAVIQKKYADRKLGAYRGTLLSAYAKFDMAAHEEEKTGGLRQRQIIGEHPFYVAKHSREAAQAEFEGALETDKFTSNYESLVAEQQVKLAESNVMDAAQRLRILGVTEDIGALLAHAGDVSAARPADEDVTAYTIAAPFDCTVISKSTLAVPSQKIEMNDVLFGLADLATVWVMANVPESDFSVLPDLQQGKIRLNATAYPGRNLEARVLSVGATVDPTTRSVPMLAETINADGLLKLGMFVRIVLDTANQSKGLTVPVSAVVDIEGKQGVFVPEPKDKDKEKDKGGQTFAFRRLKLGREAGDRREVTSGLNEGESVVSQGAFFLKSELILQNETEEE